MFSLRWVVHMYALVLVYSFYISEMFYNNILKIYLTISLTSKSLITNLPSANIF